MTTRDDPDLDALRERLARGARVAVLTGAGISAASGVPTFRGADDGLWSRYRPQDLASPEAFARDPELVWRWYDWRRALIAAAEPNPAHLALAELALRVPLTLVTQNVDALHQRAGSTGVLEYHGSIWTLRCTACARAHADTRVPLPIPPRCADCGALLRPGVVWFGEPIDPVVMRAATRAAAGCEVFLVVGTAGVVYPAAGLVDVARQAGALVVECNLEPSALTPLVQLFVPGDAAVSLPRLLAVRPG